ncbi:hypothetical protein Tco_0684848 [Tanacetum coccineum]
MTQRYEMSMLGVLTYFFEFQIKQSEGGISINQETYVKDLLKKYDINGSSVKTPMVPPNNLGPDLNDKAVNETQYRAISSAEAEYEVAAGCCANILWMNSQLTYYDIIYEKVPIFCDITNAIAISNNPVLHSRTKHIDIRYHFIRDYILKGDIELHFIPSQYQLADIFTKPLDEPTFKRLIVELATALENSKISFSIPYGGIFGEVRVNTFRNVVGAHYLAHSSEYVAPPSIDAEDIILKLKKKQREKVVPYTQFISLLIMHKIKEGCGDDEATKGGSSKVPTGSKTGHSKKRKESSSAMDSNPSQPPVSTPVDSGMHKEDQQATGVPTSLWVTSEARANPQLNSGNDASAISTAEADPKNSAPSDFASSIARQVEEEEASSTIKLENLAKLASNVQPSFKDLDSLEDDHVIIIKESDEENDKIHATKNVETKDTSVPKSLSPNSSLPTELKDIPSMLNELTGEVQGLKKQVHDLEIELPGELNEIPTKLEDFTKTVASVQAKLKTLDALPGLLSNVTKALNKFAQVLDSALSKAEDQSVPSAGQADTMPAKGEKNINQATIS